MKNLCIAQPKLARHPTSRAAEVHCHACVVMHSLLRDTAPEHLSGAIGRRPSICDSADLAVKNRIAGPPYGSGSAHRKRTEVKHPVLAIVVRRSVSIWPPNSAGY